MDWNEARVAIMSRTADADGLDGLRDLISGQDLDRARESITDALNTSTGMLAMLEEWASTEGSR